MITTCAILFGGALATAVFVKDRFGHISSSIIKLEGNKYLDTFKYYLEARKLAKVFGTPSNGQLSEFAEAIPVLLYHGILDKPTDVDVSQDDFKEQMFALKQAGWQTISLSDFYLFMGGEKKLPEKSFLLTFDDGTKSSYYRADPILKVLNYRAVSFVITKYSIGDGSGGRYYLSEQELKRMIESGRWDIQSHSKDAHNFYTIDSKGTQGHFLSNRIWLESEKRLETNEEFLQRTQNDLLAAKYDIESRLGTKVISFAFPFGDFGQNTPDNNFTEFTIVNETLSIYPMAFYQTWFSEGEIFNHPNSQARSFMIKRLEILAGMNAQAVLHKLSNHQPKHLPFHKEEFGEEWTHSWGNVISGETLTLKATISDKGALTFLAGSVLFKDYGFFARVDQKPEDEVSLLVRFKDGNNYLSCDFKGDFILVSERFNGKNRTIIGQEHNVSLPNNNLWLGARINGDTLDCLIGDKVVAKGVSVNPKLESGGVGFKLWSPTASEATLLIKEVAVAEANQIAALVSLPSYSLKPTERESEKVVANLTVTNNMFEASTKAVSNGGSDSPVLYETVGTNIQGVWQSIYGKIFMLDDTFHIGAGDLNKASLAVLHGSDGLVNYKMTATVDWFKGESFGLVTRYKDSENYASCDYSFDGAYVGLYLLSGGKSVLLGRSPRLPIPYIEPWRNRAFSVAVSGNDIKCLVGEDVILQYSIPSMQKNGGIGFSTWDRNNGNTDIAVKSIAIEEIK